MKMRFVAVSIIVFSSFALSQGQAPLGTMLEKYLERMGDNEAIPVWVYFHDKGPLAEQKLSLTPRAFLSERAILRRQKVLGSAPIIDMQDIPLERSYVDAVRAIASKVRHEVKWFNALSVVATREQIAQLRRLPFVSNVELVARFRRREVPEGESPQPLPQPQPDEPSLIDYGQSFTQNNQINAVAVHNLGINGSGVLIGIFDAGFSNLTHPALVTRPIVARYDFVTNSPTLGSHSHGQNTFSVIGGYAEGNLIGPAFGASFVLARTEDATPETPIEEDNWARAIIWADSIGIDVASTSLGYIDFDPPWPGWTWQNMDGNTTVITRAADRAVQMGIVVVNSAGNGGSVSEPANTLGAPADGFNVIAAGAVNSSGTRSSFSSVGPSADGRIKPDVMAMGEGVRGASGATGYTNFLSGTSFSCPLSAGVAALVLSGNLSFNLTPLQVRDAMRQTASRANIPDRFYGWGILDALKAVNYAWIEHTPLTDTEDTTARTVVVTVKSREPLVSDSTRVVYGIGGIFTGSAQLMPTSNPNEFSAQIPFLGNGVLVTYYIAAKNQYVSTRSPLSAPAQYYSYRVGVDTVQPSITHRVLGNQSIASWPALVSATVSDRSGVDSVRVEYLLNGQPQPMFALPALGNNTYADTFHLSRAQVNPGDSVAYRIIAVDRSSQANVSTVPASGYITFAILNYANVEQNFGDTTGGFTGTNDWQWGVPSGTSPPPRSPSRYWGTNLSGNYTVGPRLSSLSTPPYAVFSDRASFSFWHWYEIQSRFDGANVKASVNGGPFQLIQPVGGYPTAAIYNGFGNPLAGQPGFSNVGGTSWERVTFDLTGIVTVGNTVALRFDFGADNGIQYRGWYIDDFVSDGFGTGIATGVQPPVSVPKEFALEQNYPNPFNPSTVIRYQVPINSKTSLKVFNLLGQEVATLVDDVKSPGRYEVLFDGAGLSSGVYFYRLVAGSFSSTKKLILIR